MEFKENYQFFKNKVQQILQDIEFPLMISTGEQADFLQSVKPLVDGERFMFVIDLITCDIQHSIGVEKWLGFNHKEFSMFDYLKILYPSYVEQLLQIALVALEITHQKPGICRFLDQRLIICQPMKDKNGKFWWVKRETTPFQFDAKGRLTAYANFFTVIKEYQGESLAPRYSDLAGQSNSTLYELFIARYQKKIQENLPFTKRQLEILVVLADNLEFSNLRLSQYLKISKQTIDKHHQNILISARERFPQEFNSAQDVALLLRNEKIL